MAGFATVHNGLLEVVTRLSNLQNALEQGLVELAGYDRTPPLATAAGKDQQPWLEEHSMTVQACHGHLTQLENAVEFLRAKVSK